MYKVKTLTVGGTTYDVTDDSKVKLPATAGNPGQILTAGENGNTVWRDMNVDNAFVVKFTGGEEYVGTVYPDPLGVFVTADQSVLNVADAIENNRACFAIYANRLYTIKDVYWSEGDNMYVAEWESIEIIYSSSGDRNIARHYIRHYQTSGNYIYDEPIRGLSNLQTKTIIDDGDYFQYDTVEDALQEIGESLQNINAKIYVVDFYDGSGDSVTSSKTASEVISAFSAGYICIGINRYQTYFLTGISAIDPDDPTIRWNTASYISNNQSSITMSRISQTGSSGTRYTDTVNISGGGGGGTASDVTVSDAGGYFTSGNVEGALQEIGATLDGVETALSDINDIIEGLM